MAQAKSHFEAGSPRYYLDGEPLHAGDTVELQLECGTWTSGRYEHSWSPQKQEIAAYILAARQRFDIDTVNIRWPETA